MNVPPRLHIEFASSSSLTVILRRGPSEWTHLLLWDTSTDQLEGGAWFHGRIYENCCSLSPNGKLFSYLAAKHQGNHCGDDCGAWVAISRPPWLTAIAFWPQHGTQGINTDFVDDSTLIISHPYWDELTAKDELPQGFNILPSLTGKGTPEQSLPKPVKSTARFLNNQGIDQNHRAFEYNEGKLLRDGVIIADFAAMKPQPVESPTWARSW